MDRIAIHGFGRMGRSTLRGGLADRLFVPACISDVKDVAMLGALFEVDSNYGRWHDEVTPIENGLVVGEAEIPYVDVSEDLPNWNPLE